MFKIIDLFCGAGGFSYGFEMLDFETILAIDKWDQAVETFNLNHKTPCSISLDIHMYDDDKLKALIKGNEVHGIIGGPPCQGFSMVGTRDKNDDRNNLYLQYVRFVDIIRPMFFILENVKGLLTLENGYYKKDIIERFTGLGYNVNFKLLRASEYGVPQNRERVFFVGLNRKYFDGKYFEFPEANTNTFVSTEMALSDLPNLDEGNDPKWYASEATNSYQRLMRRGSENGFLQNHEITLHSEQTKSIINLIPNGGNIKDLPEEYYKIRNYNAAFKRMNSELPSTTIDCGHRNYFHYKENRIPTVREAARIQSFPDKFVFLGSKTSQYTQVGNAVPPLLAYKLGEKMINLIKESKLKSGDEK